MQYYPYEFMIGVIVMGVFYTFIGCRMITDRCVPIAYAVLAIGLGLFLLAAHESGNDTVYPVLGVAWLCVYTTSSVISACLDDPPTDAVLDTIDPADSSRST